MDDLISRSALWTDIMMLPHNGDIISSEEVEQAIVDAPSVDAVPVVRCKDCGYSFRNNGHEKDACPIRDANIWLGENGFCSLGKRRADDVDTEP